MTPTGARYDRGKAWVGYASWIVTLCAGAALLSWQFWNQPDLTRSSQAQRATADARAVVKDSGIAQLVQADAEFTRADISGQNTLLVTVYVQQGQEDAATTRARLSAAIRDRLRRDYNVTPLVDVTVLEK